MGITPADIVLLASARMADTVDGGGAMTGTALQDGTDNNVFPDVSSTDRAFGRLALRKVYPAVLNDGTDTFLGSHVILKDMPDDANVIAFAFAAAGSTETRAEAVARLQQPHWLPLGAVGGDLRWSADRTRLQSLGGAVPVSVGSVVYPSDPEAGYLTPVLITSCVEVDPGDEGVGFPSSTGTSRAWIVETDGTVPTGAVMPAVLGVPATGSPRLAGTRPITGALSIGDTYCDVPSVLAQVVPKHWGIDAGAADQIGIDGSLIMPAGVAAAFRTGDGLVIHHTAATSAAAAVVGGTVNCGRGDLSSVRVIGNDGHAISTGWTPNLTAGTVHWDDVTGWSQPVHVEHTIEEVLGCARTGYPEIPGGSVVGANSQTVGPFALSSGLTMFCGAPNVGSIRVYSRFGQDITDLRYSTAGGLFRPLWFTPDLFAGTMTFHSDGLTPLFGPSVAAIIASYSPVTIVSGGTNATAVATAAQALLNRISFNRPLTRAFPAGSLVSSMLLLGDMQAAAGVAFSQQTWTAVWSDTRIGDPIIAQYQQLAHPIEVNNNGSVNERWALIFTTATAFRVVGETLGQIATGDIFSDLAPVNPGTGHPYFTLWALGWGGGWAAGNVLRYPTRGASAPIWAARAVLPSAPSDAPDSLTFAVRGDINA